MTYYTIIEMHSISVLKNLLPVCHYWISVPVISGGPGNRLSSRAMVRGGVLTFTAVDPADEGEYTCKALNTHGAHTARATLYVQSMLH